jgi:beta-phosphoglucomutase family hydrolase
MRLDPGGLRGAVFDTDGVLTDTASLHAAAWQRLFDEFLAERAGEPGTRPFDPVTDYLTYIDGRSREDGASAFLASRGLEPPGGSVGGRRAALRELTDQKDRYFLRLLREQGPRPYPSTLDFVRSLRSHGVPCAAVSASRHCREVLRRAGIEGLFAVRVDGVDAARLALPGKPDPAVFLEAARRLGSPPERTLLVEDALAGVRAARSGGFRPIVALDRGAGAEALADCGADLVVRDLAEITLAAGSTDRR